MNCASGPENPGNRGFSLHAPHSPNLAHLTYQGSVSFARWFLAIRELEGGSQVRCLQEPRAQVCGKRRNQGEGLQLRYDQRV